MTDTADSLLSAYGRGEMTFAELVTKFTTELPMTLPLETREPARTWGEVYQRAEEGDDTDIPAALSRASYAREITEAEAEQLRAIYKKRVIDPLGDDPRLRPISRRGWPEGLQISHCGVCGDSRAEDRLVVAGSEKCRCDASTHHSVFCLSCSQLFCVPPMGPSCGPDDGCPS